MWSYGRTGAKARPLPHVASAQKGLRDRNCEGLLGADLPYSACGITPVTTAAARQDGIVGSVRETRWDIVCVIHRGAKLPYSACGITKVTTAAARQFDTIGQLVPYRIALSKRTAH